MVDDQRGESAPIPWYEESWAVVTAGVAGVLAIGVLIYAVVQTSENSLQPSGPQYYTDYSGSTSSTTSTSTTTSRTTRSSTTTTTTTESTTTESTTTASTTTETTTTESTSAESTTTEESTTEESTTETTPTLDDENPFILDPFATTTAEAG